LPYILSKNASTSTSGSSLCTTGRVAFLLFQSV
jgi:hypothetical protein